ncbi:uroporphyrinogen-III synthase [Arcticibacterium luteifluviistationis]|uniref:Uroporphyrinogen-III synthase n=1 Tax=Arcticibacterium luteifluviistationis TaxID=1784714 RepID=A0A2Z4GD49_9BACT|nr:uroporphyrinogen-III synthase [Arcticibacterium luteifluviistationis]AWV99037.1 uroporphyrinogen-III synthase [Arcticibacterium luteifluviistationis]
MSQNLEKDLGKDRKKKVESILVTLSDPLKAGKNNTPYDKLKEKYGIKVDFRNFIAIDGLSSKEFRKQKVDILSHTAIIFTSRNAVDHFFRLCADLRIEMPIDMKYFCISEQTANYLQKYITIRKRKIFSGTRTAADLEPFLAKNKKEKFLFPCSNIRNDSIPDMMERNGIALTEAIIYETGPADLSDLTEVFYDVICFFSPSGVQALVQNFEGWKQKNTRLAAFGSTTAQAIQDEGLILDIQAPLPNAPSMTGALEVYIKEANNL